MNVFNLEKKAIAMEVKLQRLLKIPNPNGKDKKLQSEIYKLFNDLNSMWREISYRSR